jgi:hypothetical protein
MTRLSGQPRQVDIRLVDQAAGQAEARRDLNGACFIDLVLPNPLRVSAQIFEPVLPGGLRQTP